MVPVHQPPHANQKFWRSGRKLWRPLRKFAFWAKVLYWCVGWRWGKRSLVCPRWFCGVSLFAPCANTTGKWWRTIARGVLFGVTLVLFRARNRQNSSEIVGNHEPRLRRSQDGSWMAVDVSADRRFAMPTHQKRLELPPCCGAGLLLQSATTARSSPPLR